MNLHPFSKNIWEQNYKSSQDDTIQDTWMRVACAMASVEKDKKKWTDKFYDILSDFKFVPGGRIIANAGVPERNKTTLMNCYAIHPEGLFEDIDSIEGIYSMLQSQAKTLASEGGYGINFSWIRPSGSYVNGGGIRTPGVLAFMDLWDKSAEIITVGSDKKLKDNKKEEKKKARKGAMMAVLSDFHPDIIDFIEAKNKAGKYTKFNMSVGVSNALMEAVEKDADWNLEYPDSKHPAYKKEWNGDIQDWKNKGYETIIYQTLKAKELWEMILKNTFLRNEPGVLFLDVINEYNPLYYKEKIRTTNPCGEIPLEQGACNLGSINLTQFIFFDHSQREYKFDYQKFAEIIPVAVRFLDNVNDITAVPLEIYKKAMVEKRKIGLGLMGLGSLHFMLGIKYGSSESLKLITNIMQIKTTAELKASSDLGKEKGNFKDFDKNKYFNSKWFKNLPISEDVKEQIKKQGTMRNSTHSMNAPNGQTGIFANLVSGGIEPVFMKEYIRWVSIPVQQYNEIPFKFPNVFKGEWFETEYFKFTYKGDEQILKATIDNVMYEIDKNRGLIKAELIEDYGWKFIKEKELKYSDEVLVTTSELTVNEHINVLKTIAPFVNMNSSKTINLPNSYTFEDFKNVYFDAWKNNIKGITTYREGTMTAVLEKVDEQKTVIEDTMTELEKQYKEANGNIITKDLSLPDVCLSKTLTRRAEGIKWYFHITFADENMTKPFAFFIQTNNKESVKTTNNIIDKFEEYAYTVGIDKDIVEKHVEKVKNQNVVDRFARALSILLRHNVPIENIIEIIGEQPITSVLFHVKKILGEFVPEKELTEKCEICEANLVLQEGCKICPQCGWSKCG